MGVMKYIQLSDFAFPVARSSRFLRLVSMAHPALPPQPAPQALATVVDAGSMAKQASYTNALFEIVRSSVEDPVLLETSKAKVAIADETLDWSPNNLILPNQIFRAESLTTNSFTASNWQLAQEAEAVPSLEPSSSPANAEELAPLLESTDLSPASSEFGQSTTFSEQPIFGSPSITEPLIDFDALPTREQNVIPIAPALPSELIDERLSTPAAAEGEKTPASSNNAAGSTSDAPPETAPAVAPDLTGIIELQADSQIFDQQRQVISAEGDVLMRFQSGVLSADRLQINLLSRVVVADGNAAFVRGQQRLQGERIEYNITQDSGRVAQASGEVFTPSSGTDFLPPGPANPTLPNAPVSDRLTQAQPLTNVSNPGQITITTGFSTNFETQDVDDETDSPADVIQIPISISAFRQEGTINRWRFESDELALVPGGFDATDVRLTNDPFSPPQFEIRAKKIEVRSVSPLVDEILATKPRYVFEDKVSIPTFKRRLLLDRRPRDPGLVTFGFDSRDRGGLFFERSFEPISTEKFRFNVTPQFYLQRSLFDSDGLLDLANFGVRAGVEAKITPNTLLTGSARFDTLEPNDLGDNTRGRVNLQQGLPLGHTLDLNYGYRNRVYNGSLGFRTVRQNYGAVVRSPNIPIGNTGIVVNYQGGLQRITADTDRADLLEPIRDNNRVTLTRYQVGASASRGFSLWRGKALPATAEEGLRFSPVPVTPNANFSISLTGLYSGYSNGDSQDSITTTLGFNGQVGHFSKDWLDYTGWNLTYSQALRGDESPFTFDRVEDTRVLSFGLRQQLYGPIRVGLQSSISLQTGERFSTDYLLEYSRRAYGVELRYNPVLELGSVTLRISDFNWLGGTDPFSELKTGVQQ